MVFNIGVSLISLVLLVYWFRYTCLLLLRTQPVRDYSKQVAAANQLNVFAVRARLELASFPAEPQHLDELERLLDRDYRLLKFLRVHASSFRSSGYHLDQIMLDINYYAVKQLYLFSRRSFPARARGLLSEMADMITHIANSMGERAALDASQ